MQLTVHGLERIQDRTRMKIPDVLDVIKQKACINLGYDSLFNYFLFYSPFDERTKIAVAGRNDGALVSVWESTFRLPAQIQCPTYEYEYAAFALMKKYVLNRAYVPSDPQPIVPARRSRKTRDQPLYRVCLEIFATHKDGVREFITEIGSGQYKKPVTPRRLVSQFRDALHTVTTTIDDYDPYNTHHYSYCFSFWPVLRGSYFTMRLRHKTLKALLEAG